MAATDGGGGGADEEEVSAAPVAGTKGGVIRDADVFALTVGSARASGNAGGGGAGTALDVDAAANSCAPNERSRRSGRTTTTDDFPPPAAAAAAVEDSGRTVAAGEGVANTGASEDVWAVLVDGREPPATPRVAAVRDDVSGRDEDGGRDGVFTSSPLRRAPEEEEEEEEVVVAVAEEDVAFEAGVDG